MKFIIVEDEVRIREGIRRLILKMDGKNVIVGEAENGKEGLEIIRKEKPDVIITDVRMPIMDGLEMLEILHKEGCTANTVVLTAYSEFEYARTAVKLGVTEYLLKPIVLAEFFETINRIKQMKQKKNQWKRTKQIGSLDQIIKNVLSGDLCLEQETINYTETEFGIDEEIPLALLICCFEDWISKNCERYIRKIKTIMFDKPEINFCIWENEKQREIGLLLYNYEDGRSIKRWLQGHFLCREESMKGMALGWVESENIFLLKNSYEALEKYLEWNILLGEEVIISYPDIKHIKTSVCMYPMEIENQMKIAICANNYRMIEKCTRKFQRYFETQKMYDPKQVKECYIRFLWMVINLSKETGNFNFENIEQRGFLERISNVRTRQGLQNIISELMLNLQKQEERIENLNVKRTVALIHEFYQSGITLDEIAGKLGVTPEYLGMQFHQETGVNFSTYVKALRINKAKELLVGTQLKLYEIAELVGYSDSKYFSKVFKADTGQLPAEYRRTHK